MLQSVFGTLKLHDFDSPDYLDHDRNNNKDGPDGDRTPDIRSVTSTGSPTHLVKHANALRLTTDGLDNGAYLRLGPFNMNNQLDVNIYENYMEEMEEEVHIQENYTNRWVSIFSYFW